MVITVLMFAVNRFSYPF